MVTLTMMVTRWWKTADDDGLSFSPPQPMLLGVSQIVVIYPISGGRQTCIQMASGDKFDTTATVEQIMRALVTRTE